MISWRLVFLVGSGSGILDDMMSGKRPSLNLGYVATIDQWVIDVKKTQNAKIFYCGTGAKLL